MRQMLLAPVLLMSSLLTLLLTACNDGNDRPRPEPVAPSSLTIAPTAVPEGGPGEMSRLRFRATMTEPQPEPVLVRYNTEADSAIADVDFLPAQGEVAIPAGELVAEISVEIFGNAEDESAKTLRLNFAVEGNAVPTSTSEWAPLPMMMPPVTRPSTRSPIRGACSAPILSITPTAAA